jgi:putative peptidoglycan lipid II flippase
LSDEVNHASPGRLLRAAGPVSGLTLLSRILGLVREQVFAALLGAGFYADAFQIGFRIPNLLRDLFAEGALSAAFVPTYARVQAEQGRPAAHRLASRLITVLAVVLGVLVLLGMLFAEAIVDALAPGFRPVPGKVALTVALTRVMLPFLILVSFAAVAMGMHNADERFGRPALAPALFNVVTILWAGVLWALGLPLRQVVLGWAAGTLLGGAAQFLVQVPSLVRDGWRFRAEWAPRDPGLRRIAALMTPATVGLAAVQINIFVNNIFASQEPGAVSWLNYAFRILYLPIGIFGVAVGTIAGARLARRAAEADMEGLRETLRGGLRMLAFLTLPATAGLGVLGVPIVRLIYQRGRFGASDTEATAVALAFYSLGLVAYTGVKVLAPAFYALGSPRVPLAASALAVATNLVVILLLHEHLGFRAVALGTSLGAFANALLLGAAFQFKVGGLRGHGLGRAALAMAGAAAVMAPVAAGAAAWVEATLGTRGLPAQLAAGVGPVLVGIAVYFAVARLLGIPEAREVLALVRLGRGSR